MQVLSIKEYDKLYIRRERALDKNTISASDAAYLQSVTRDGMPVFGFGSRCLIAQQWVGVIDLPDFSIEILPKLSGEISDVALRQIIIRMLLVSHQAGVSLQLRSSVSMRENSLAEMLIETFLQELLAYAETGLQHEYVKIFRNIGKVKGQICFSQHLKKNILAPTRFFCRYSSYIADNKLNRFFKTCLEYMALVSRDVRSHKLIEELQMTFSLIGNFSREQALSVNVEFNSVNVRAQEAYLYGRMFLENIQASLSAGRTKIYTMLFNMNQLYELFVYRTASMVFGNRITYQKRGNYLVSRDSDKKKFVTLRPDLTFKAGNSDQWIIDTKWKLPGTFAKESDVYQMNAYSTGIPNVGKVVILYPKSATADSLVGRYTFLSGDGQTRPLEIMVVDLAGCLSWNEFLRNFRQMFGM